MAENFFDQYEDGAPVSDSSSDANFFDQFEGEEEENFFAQFGPIDAPIEEKPEPPAEVNNELEWSDVGKMVMQGGASIAAGMGWLVEKVGQSEQPGLFSEEGPDALDRWVSDKIERAGAALKKQGFKSADDWVNKRMEHIGVDSEGLSEPARRAMKAELLGEEATGAEKWNKVKLMTASSLLGTAAGMGAGKLFTSALAVGATSATARTAAATAGYGAGEAFVAAPSAGAQTEQEIMAMNHEQLMESLEYQAVLDGLDMPEAEARKKAQEIIARAAAGDTAAIAAISTFALSAPFGNKLDKIMRGVSGKGRIGAGLSGASTEAVQEFLQSGGEAIAGNIGKIRAGFDVDPLEGALEEAVGGAAAGGLMGGTMGTLAGPQPLETDADLDEDTALAEIERIQREAEERAAAAGGDALEQALAGAEAAAEAGAAVQSVMQQGARIIAEEEYFQTEQEEQAAAKEEAFAKAEEEAAAQKEIEVQKAEAQREEQKGEEIEAQAEREEKAPAAPTLGETQPALQELKQKLKPPSEEQKKATKKVKALAKKKVEKDKGVGQPVLLEDLRPDVVVDKTGQAMSKEQIAAEKKRLEVDVAAGETPLPPSELNMERRIGPLKIAIETPEGNTRTGRKPDGTRWESKMTDVDYGFIRGSRGADQDQIDAFVSTNPVENSTVVVIDQVNQETGEFDEHKVMLGFANRAAAVVTYKQHYEKGWKVGPVTEMTQAEFDTWVKDGRKDQPLDTDLQAIPATEEEVQAAQKKQRGIKRRQKKEPKALYALPEGMSVQATEEALPGGGAEVSLELVDEKGAVRGGITADVIPEARQIKVSISKVDEELQGRGVGIEMYNEMLQRANSEGYELVSDISVSKAAARVYEALERRGATVIRNPAATLNERGDWVTDDIRNPVFRVLPTDIKLARSDLAAQIDEEVGRAADIAVTARAVVETMPGAEAEVVETPADLPQDVFDLLKDKDALAARGVFLPKSGRIFIIASNNQNVDEAIATILHEAVGHKGLRALLGEKLPALLDNIWENGNRSAIRTYAERYGFDIENTNERRQATEEYVAHLAEVSPNATILRRVVDAIRAFLREIDVLSRWTDNDIHALLRDVRRNMGKPLNQIELVSQAEIEETGEVVDIAEQADVVLRQHDKRMDVIEKLRGCLAA